MIKNPETKRPMPFMQASFLMLPCLFGAMAGLTALVAIHNKTIETFNWSFGYWMLGISTILVFVIVMRMVYIAEEYIWHYLALCKLLKDKGLER